MTRAAQDQDKRPLPRYLAMAGELREAILEGRFADGRLFPTENALCKQYNVSRYTVREALRRLQAEGLIARRRGSGTTVQPAGARGGALHQPLSNVGELLQYARDSVVTYAEVPTDGPLPRGVAEQLAEDTRGNWRCFEGVRRQHESAPPIAATSAFFHERLGKCIDQLDLAGGTLFSQVERLCGISIGKVTQDIQAIAADAPIAAKLEVDEASPVLRILRCYVDPGGTPFEISVSHHPGESFAYTMHIDVEG